MSTVITYPISAYQNPPIQPQFYQPSQFIVTGVSIGVTTTVTTSVNLNYVVGQECRLLIPHGYGCIQLNEVTGLVIDVPSSNQVTLNIDSSKADPFISAALRETPQIVAVGSINSGRINANGVNSNLTFIPGSFINISPL